MIALPIEPSRHASRDNQHLVIRAAAHGRLSGAVCLDDRDSQRPRGPFSGLPGRPIARCHARRDGAEAWGK